MILPECKSIATNSHFEWSRTCERHGQNIRMTNIIHTRGQCDFTIMWQFWKINLAFRARGQVLSLHYSWTRQFDIKYVLYITLCHLAWADQRSRTHFKEARSHLPWEPAHTCSVNSQIFDTFTKWVWAPLLEKVLCYSASQACPNETHYPCNEIICYELFLISELSTYLTMESNFFTFLNESSSTVVLSTKVTIMKPYLVKC